MSVAGVEQATSTAPSAAASSPRPRLLGEWQGDGASLTFAGTHNGYDRLPVAAARPRGPGPCRPPRHPRPRRGRCRPRGDRAACCSILTASWSWTAAHARLGSAAAVEVRGRRRLPLAAEPAEWYPDPTSPATATRLVYRFRAGDSARRDHALAQPPYRVPSRGCVKVFVVDQSLLSASSTTSSSPPALAAAGADATLVGAAATGSRGGATSSQAFACCRCSTPSPSACPARLKPRSPRPRRVSEHAQGCGALSTSRPAKSPT